MENRPIAAINLWSPLKISKLQMGAMAVMAVMAVMAATVVPSPSILLTWIIYGRFW
jgi:hypothetical protein